MYRLIWTARSKKYKIYAVWWKGCVVPLTKWRKVVKALYPDCVIDYNKVYLWPEDKIK